MTDYIEWVLESVEDEEEAGRPWDAGSVRAPAVIRRVAGKALPQQGAAWGYGALPGGGSAPSVTGSARDSSPDQGAKASADGTGAATRGEVLIGEEPEPGLWTDGLRVERVLRFAHQGVDGMKRAREIGSGGAGVLLGMKRAASAAAALERGRTVGRTVVEQEAVPSPAADPAALDLVFQRDARRYDGRFDPF